MTDEPATKGNAMTRRRDPVRLTAKDWLVIFDTLDYAAWPEALLTLRKIGVDGMAARDRGVAKVKGRPKR